MPLIHLFALLISPFVGSFLGVVIERLPEGRAVLWDRSTCDHCGRLLKPWSMIPLASYLLQRGRCRECGEKISGFYPLVEVLALAVAASAVLLVPGWPLWASLYLGWSLLVLAWIDLRHKFLPDAVNLPLIPAGLLVTLLLAPSLLPAHLLGAVLGFGTLAAIAWSYR
ncbi:MAG: prepilin peptidase, partial [Alkalinema sp. RU_4_3]|nr:prepilin peptidase [Alkalinema sp. RU_4_3]